MSRDFDLGDYVQVKDRIAKFYELYGNGRLVTSQVMLTREPDDKPRVLVEAKAYRNPDDLLPGVGWSWLELPGSTPYTKGSEVENAETSAWGRAIAALGILTDHSIASAQEVRDKGGVVADDPKAADDGWHGPRDPRGRPAEALTLLGDVSRSGKVIKGDAQGYDLEARESPDGYAIGFKLDIAKDKNIPQVLADGPLGHALFLALGGEPLTLLKQRVSVRGRLYEVHPGPGRQKTFRLLLTAIETPEFTLPAPATEDVPPEPPETPSAPEFGPGELDGIFADIDKQKDAPKAGATA